MQPDKQTVTCAKEHTLDFLKAEHLILGSTPWGKFSVVRAMLDNSGDNFHSKVFTTSNKEGTRKK
jgi:hypothetical protein